MAVRNSGRHAHLGRDLAELLAVAQEGVHDPALMPFSTPWTDADPAELPAEFVRYHWSSRAQFSAERFTLNFAVRCAGDLVGTQAFSTESYPITRTGETGSWLGRRFHGQGIGTRMRQAVCAFVFDHLDANEITSGAFVDNPSSLGVSRKVGYVPNRDEATRPTWRGGGQPAAAAHQGAAIVRGVAQQDLSRIDHGVMSPPTPTLGDGHSDSGVPHPARQVGSRGPPTPGSADAGPTDPRRSARWAGAHRPRRQDPAVALSATVAAVVLAGLHGAATVVLWGLLGGADSDEVHAVLGYAALPAAAAWALIGAVTAGPLVD